MPERFHAIMPAAGLGRRLGAGEPKQYLALAGEPMLARSARAVLAADWIDGLIVVVAPDDTRAAPLFAGWDRVAVRPVGGPSRRDSVLAGLQALDGDEYDWVLVHDAARPGLAKASLQALRAVALEGETVGALLALPVADTVRRDDGGRPPRGTGVLAREHLWLAQTPQMFRLGALRAALLRHPEVTDEAAAIEADGGAPRLVVGTRDNFKVTTADDLELMSRLLGARGAAGPRATE